jgi:hypothetical protein
LPKWFGDVLKAGNTYDLTRIGRYNKEKRIKEDEISIASLGLYKSVLAWDGKGSLKANLRSGIKFALGYEFKDVSIGEHQKGKKRKEEWQEIKQSFQNSRKAILREDMDRFGGGSLDEPVGNDDSGNRDMMTKQDIQLLSEKKGVERAGHTLLSEQKSQRKRVIKKENLDRFRQKYPRFWGISKQMLMGGNITPTDQRYYKRNYERIIKELEEKQET